MRVFKIAVHPISSSAGIKRKQATTQTAQRLGRGRGRGRGGDGRVPYGPYRDKKIARLCLRRNAGPAVFARAFSALINEVSVTSGRSRGGPPRSRSLAVYLGGRGQFKAAVITLTRRA